MIVMMMASTPSLKASRRLVFMARCLYMICPLCQKTGLRHRHIPSFPMSSCRHPAGFQVEAGSAASFALQHVAS
jgi:hypothetical protein